MIGTLEPQRARDTAREDRLRMVHQAAQRHLNSPKGGHRQADVLAMASIGLTDREIAQKLGMSPETVSTYWRRVMALFGASSRTEAVAILLVRELNRVQSTDKGDEVITERPRITTPRFRGR